MKALTKTDFHFDGQKSVYHGKVRDVYDINDDLLVMVATDRISAFDVVLPKGIPFKGQVLNQIAAKFLDTTTDICPNWKLATPDPMVTVGLKCEGFRVEMIIRSILTGSAWREYQKGCREICGVKLPDGMRENQRFVMGQALDLRDKGILDFEYPTPTGQAKPAMMSNPAHPDHADFKTVRDWIDRVDPERRTLPQDGYRDNLAAAVVLAHNHPSGVSEPSPADQVLTRELKQALALIDVRVLDHFIVAGQCHPLSFAERGFL